MTRPPLAPRTWQPGDEPPRARWFAAALGVAAIAVLVGLLVPGRLAGLFFVIAAAMAGLSVLVLVAPKNLGEWDPDYENGRRHFYEETAVGRFTARWDRFTDRIFHWRRRS
jgi:hypothetical protein